MSVVSCPGGLALEKRVVGLEARRRPGHQLGPHAVGQGQVQRVRHLGRDVGLHLEHVGERRVELLAPAGARRLPRPGVHQLRRHAHPAGGARRLLPTHRAGEQVVRSQLARDLRRPLRRPAVLVGAAAGDDLEAAHLGQLGPHLVGDAVGEVGVGRVAQVLEGEYGQDLGTGAAGADGARPPPGEQHAQTDQDAEDEDDGGPTERRNSGTGAGSSGRPPSPRARVPSVRRLRRSAVASAWRELRHRG